MKLSKLVAIVTLTGTILVGVATAAIAGQPSASAAKGVSAQASVPLLVNMVVVPDSVRGSNKKNHDAFLPATITALAGQKVIVTVYNLDQSAHSFTSPALGLAVTIKPALSDGAVGVTVFSFTAGKAGTYHWKCIIPCDNGGVNAWAMVHDGYMAGTVTIR